VSAESNLPPEGSSIRESRYSGPVTISEHDVGGRRLRLVRPAAPDRLLDHPQVIDWNRRDDYMPYWAYLWPGALLLGEVVAAEPGLAPDRAEVSAAPRVLEIGCGLGLAGLVALSRGCHVVFTDYDEAPFPFIRRSIAENGLDARWAEMARLDWRMLPDDQYPLILGSDVLYEKRLVPLVAKLLARMLAPDGVGLLSSPLRVAAEGFPQALAERSLTCRLESLSGRDEHGEATRGTLYRVTR
jgi:predicted nicotinamide N-methyase